MKYILIIISLIALTACQDVSMWGECKYKFKNVNSSEVYIGYRLCEYEVGDTVSFYSSSKDQWTIIKRY